MALLIRRLRAAGGLSPAAWWVGDLVWCLAIGGAAALVVAFTLTLSVQAACAVVAVAAVMALYRHDRRWGIVAMLAFWFLAPGLRRVLDLQTGYLSQDPLSVAPFVATAAIATLELLRIRLPARIRRITLLAVLAFALGLPAGLLLGPQAAAYAAVAYLAGVSGLILGFRDPEAGGTLRRVLLYGLPPLAAYAVVQRVFPLPHWDQAWVDASAIDSIGASDDTKVRVFSTLNSPGSLAPLLALSLLCHLSVGRVRTVTVVSATLVAVALALTFVRSAWVALTVAGLAHVVASRGRSARAVFGAAAIAVAATLALAPVTPTAREVLDRFNSISGYRTDASANDRTATFSQTLPKALGAPLGHGLGSAGEPSKLTNRPGLRTPDNGYLSLMYQVGPVGFLLFVTAAAFIMRAAWRGAQARAPGQDLRVLSFAMLVAILVQLTAGDSLYGVSGVIFWFLAGQALGFDRGPAARVAPTGESLRPAAALPA